MAKEKPKPKVKESSSNVGADILTALLTNTPGLGTPAAKVMASKIINKGLSRIAENLSPYGYSSEEGPSWERIIKAGILNRKEPRRAEMDAAISKGINLPESKVRIDLLNILANKKQKYNTVSKSPYIPPDYKQGKQYVRSNEIDELVLNNLNINPNQISSKKQLQEDLNKITITRPSGRKPTAEELKMSPFYTPLEPVVGKYGNLVYDKVMGDATYKVGEDEKGIFISYRDTWDLNPEKGGSKEPVQEASPYSIKGLYQKGGRLISRIASGLAKEYSSPAEIYGKIYFDKKTGKRIK